jgi:hypothetical protein
MKNMSWRFKRTPQSIMPAFCCMILALLLVACADGTTSTPAPTPTPTLRLTVYTGKGYSISYPQGWKVTPSSSQVDFSDATGVYNMTILAGPNPGGIADPSTFANASIAAIKKTMKNPQTETLPPTTTVGGDSWVQKSITGMENSNGQNVDLRIVVISDNHPAKSADSQNFTTLYGTEKSLFATANTSYFQPMLQSFKFT